MAVKLSSTTSKILDILNDSVVHTGSDIALTLGISRTAVWKVIQRLKKHQVDIVAQHQGYQLNSPLILMDKAKVEAGLKRTKVQLEIFESISSTSAYLKAKTLAKSGSVCLAEYQSEGRGRLGRTWVSPFGRNIYCSLSYTFNKDICEMSGLSLVVGILMAGVLESICPKLKPLLKWPNDIYINNQKAGGILIDLSAEAHGNCIAIISFGLNVNMKDMPPNSIDKPWTSLEHALNELQDRNIIVSRMIDALMEGMEIFHKEGITPFLTEWKRYDLLENQMITLGIGKEIISGIARGINPQGFLLLELPSSKIESFSYGDTTLIQK